jgi:DNA-directed RNA polymerase subunit RPC12/RpoP
MAGITEEELLGFLKAIEEGTISLQPEECIPQDIYAGNVPYLASNGWRITIFNDCNEWDYVDRVIAPDGRSLGFDEIDNFMSVAREYTPDTEVAWSRYGIPGYMRFRCTSCGADVKPKALAKAEYLCNRCGGSSEAQQEG